MTEQGRSKDERRKLDDIEEVIVLGAMTIVAVSLLAWMGWTLAKWIVQ